MVCLMLLREVKPGYGKNGYLKAMRRSKIKARNRKEKAKILDEYYCNTGRTRKYVITKIHKTALRSKQRKETYGDQVRAALVRT